MYIAIYLNKITKFVTGDDVDMTFILKDVMGNLLVSLSQIKIKAVVYGWSTELKLKNTLAGGDDTQISVDGAEFTIHMKSSDTKDFYVGTYILEIEIEKDNKINTVYNENITFRSELLDW